MKRLPVAQAARGGAGEHCRQGHSPERAAVSEPDVRERQEACCKGEIRDRTYENKVPWSQPSEQTSEHGMEEDKVGSVSAVPLWRQL